MEEKKARPSLAERIAALAAGTVALARTDEVAVADEQSPTMRWQFGGILCF